jgi:uncharacterized peroxidase-related enzyme
MAFIHTVPAREATGEVLELYRSEQGSMDYLPNYAKVFCHRPRVMQAWVALQRVIRQEMAPRSYGLISLAAAVAMGSSYCALSHARKLLKQTFTAVEMTAILRDAPDSPLSPAERAMMRLAGKIARDASSVTQADIDLLRAAGFDDAQIFDIAAAASARAFFARLPDALGAQPDPALAGLPEPLPGLLSVGRPVSADAPEKV